MYLSDLLYFASPDCHGRLPLHSKERFSYLLLYYFNYFYYFSYLYFMITVIVVIVLVSGLQVYTWLCTRRYRMRKRYSQRRQLPVALIVPLVSFPSFTD